MLTKPPPTMSFAKSSFHSLVFTSFSGAEGLSAVSGAESVALDLLLAPFLLALLPTTMLDAEAISLVKLVALGVLAELTNLVDSTASIQSSCRTFTPFALLIVVSAGFLGHYESFGCFSSQSLR